MKLFITLLSVAATSAFAETYTVTTAADSGAGSLRQAILDANGHPNSGGPDQIHFNIPGAGVHTITPTTPLPTITDPVTIDGYTEPGSSPNTLGPGLGTNAVLMIELSGAALGTGDSGLVITTGPSTVRGLSIIGFGTDSFAALGGIGGVVLRTSGGSTVEGCFLGVRPDGITAAGNGNGVVIRRSSSNIVGGTTAAARNLISGNDHCGVEMNARSTNPLLLPLPADNVVINNLIGTDRTGTAALQVDQPESGGVGGGLQSGVLLDGDRNRVGGLTPIERNVISGNQGSAGLLLQALATDCVIQGNYIGTNAAGTAAVPNTSAITLHEVLLRSIGATTMVTHGPTRTLIGGSQPGAGNIISGNLEHGISFLLQPIVIWIDDTNESVVFPLPDASPPGALETWIEGNRIGVNVNGSALGNGEFGIFMGHSTHNLIRGNEIAHNGHGIAVSGPRSIPQNLTFGDIHFAGSESASILGNSIHSNRGVGIDLLAAQESFGVTANDSQDPDTGANNLQNFPVLTSASVSGGKTTIQGTLNSTANANFRIEFFANEGADPSLYGEGQTFLGATADLKSDANGNLTFTAVLNATPPAGQTLITATATNSDSDNTSEFSQALRLTGTAGRLLNIATRLRVQTGENVLIGGIIITGTEPKKVMIRGIGPSLAQFFSGALANPTLELFQAGTLLQSNDDWKSTQRAEIEATGIAPTNDLESAIVRTLSPGGYTAIIRGAGGGTGIGLVEAYDLEQASNSALANIATRGFVDAGDNVMIGGFIAGGGGGGAVKVLVRAIGPTLSNAGIAGALQNPTLELRDSSGALIAENDDWKQTQQSEVEATTIPPNDDRESAILALLNAGNYTAIVRGSGNTTGVGLVEVYDVP